MVHSMLLFTDTRMYQRRHKRSKRKIHWNLWLGGVILKKDRADRITLYVDRKVYQEYKMYAIMINKSVSSLIEQFMRETLNEMKKEK